MLDNIKTLIILIIRGSLVQAQVGPLENQGFMKMKLHRPFLFGLILFSDFYVVLSEPLGE
jgi:hypothetical protein